MRPPKPVAFTATYKAPETPEVTAAPSGTSTTGANNGFVSANAGEHESIRDVLRRAPEAGDLKAAYLLGLASAG